MPLQGKDGDFRGSEKDGVKSEKFCKLCYENGEFNRADCTLEQMTEIVDKALKEKGWNPILRWMAIKQIPRLERWK
jgi:hypothetical protein